jgi:hypothetical protein
MLKISLSSRVIHWRVDALPSAPCLSPLTPLKRYRKEEIHSTLQWRSAMPRANVKASTKADYDTKMKVRRMEHADEVAAIKQTYPVANSRTAMSQNLLNA